MGTVRSISAAAALALTGTSLLGSGTAEAALIDLASLNLFVDTVLETDSIFVDFDTTLGLTASATGPTGALFAAFPLNDTSVTLGFFATDLPLSGDMVHQGYLIDAGTGGGDILQFTIDTDSNLSADHMITFTGEFGTDNSTPYDLLGAGFTDPVASYKLESLGVTTPTVIPLPAGLPLALAGLGGLALLRRARRA